jgi:translation initiation factor IF-3
VNEQIRAPQVQVISETGALLGIMSAGAALIEARNRGFDLVEVSPIANPPVCKIINYGQLRYENRKKEQRQKSKQKSTEVKGIRLSTTISEHDTAVRVEQAKKFFSKGNKVQVELLLRGRQKAHPEIGAEVVNKFIQALNAVAVVESPIKRQGGKFISLLTPKK